MTIDTLKIFIPVITAVVTGLVAFGLQERRLKAERAKVSTQTARADLAERLLKLRSQALKLGTNDWFSLQQELDKLFAETEIDRFLILAAINGVTDPKYCMAQYQRRAAGQEMVTYNNLPIDDDYRERLLHIKHQRTLVFSVKDAPMSMIKDIYDSEGVTAAAWFWIGHVNIDTQGHALITYCSFSSHSSETICPKTVTRCNLIVGMLRSIHQEQFGMS